jgi:hypothetical protein
MGTKDCKFCDKTGLLILPLRYAAVVGDASALADIPALPSTLGAGVKDLALTHGKYAPRMVREGYIYLLQEREGIKYWEGYMVIEDAFLYKFDVKSPPLSQVEFSCDRSVCGIDASCIAIDKVDKVTKAYFLFTPSPMTEAKLKEYKDNADSYAGKGKMQAFDPKAWAKAGSKNQEHSLKPELIGQHVAEWILYKQCDKALSSECGKAMEQQLFVPTTSALAGVPAIAPSPYQPGRLGILQRKLVEKEAVAFVMYDHIGVTQELNDYRNDAFKSTDTFIGKKEKNISNKHKFDIYNAIGQMRTAMEKGIVADATLSVEIADQNRRARVEPIFPDDSAQMRFRKTSYNNVYTHPSRQEWEAKNPDKVAKFEEALERDEERMIDTAPERSAKMWNEKYAPLLNLDEINQFNDKLNELSKTARIKADERAPQHMKWLESKQILDAFDIYDQHSPHSGEALRGHVVGCIFGMEGSEKSEAVLTEWASATQIDRKNLLMRAFIRDQDAVKKEADKTLAEVTGMVAGMGTMSAWPSTKFDKAIKGMVSAVKSTDSALDEWMRNQGQSKNYLNPKHLANTEARFFYLVSTFTRSVARKSIGGKFEMALAARANALMFACMGELASTIESKTLMNNIDPSKWEDLKKKHADAEALAKAQAGRTDALSKKAMRQARKAKVALQTAYLELVSDAQLKAKVQLSQGAKSLGWSELQKQLETSAQEHADYKKTADNLKKTESIAKERIPDNPSPTNNYHQVRLGAVLASIETISLLGKAWDVKEKGWDLAGLELTSSACSLGSILLDMMYAHTKSVRELPQFGQAFVGVDKAGDIVRGGFKLAAGLLAAFAGTITAYLDTQKALKEKDSTQRSILWMRAAGGTFSSGASFLAAFSYSGPLLEYAAFKMAAGRFITRRLATVALGLSMVADGLAARVLLLRVVAWLGWVGVAVTVVDIFYAGYRSYMDSTALERWCKRSVFRKDKNEKPFNNSKEELKELVKAQHPGQEI